MKENAEVQHCSQCRHFHNTPAYLESVFKGLSTLSSARASVRWDDGVCESNAIYVTADSGCRDFERLEIRRSK